MGLKYKKSDKLNLEVFTDSDHGACNSTRKSIGGVTIQFNGTSITAKSKRLPMITDSTASSEMLAAHIAMQETLGIRNLLESIEIYVEGPTIIWCDNETAVEIFNDRASSQRTKHMDIRIHAVRDAIKNKMIEVRWKATADMTADILTKGLGRNQHGKLVHQLGMAEIDASEISSLPAKGSVRINDDVAGNGISQDNGKGDPPAKIEDKYVSLEKIKAVLEGKIPPNWLKPVLERHSGTEKGG
jgi:hypothetical protein